MAVDRKILLLPAVVFCWATVMAGAGNVSSNMAEAVKSVVTSAAGSAAEAGMMRDMAVNAVRNAMAAEHNAEEAYLSDVKIGDKTKIISGKKALEEADESVEDARKILERIACYAAESAVAADLAKEQEKTVASSKTNREAERALKKAGQFAESSKEVSKKARNLADILKKKWLLPIPVATEAGTEAQSPTPAGVR